MAPRMVQFFDSDGLRLAYIDVAPRGRRFARRRPRQKRAVAKESRLP
jgi:hypothetical protein